MSNTIGNSGFVSPSQLADYQSNANREPVQNLGKDEFLMLLATQMSNQDPLEPMEDTDFIAQMAQFTSLEQMQQLNQSFGVQQAYTLIGKNIAAMLDDSTQVIGNVTGVFQQNGKAFLQVGSYKVPMETVTEIYDTGHDSNALVAQSAYLIGKHIDAEAPVDRTDLTTGLPVTEMEKISGEVESVLVKNFTVYVKLKDTGKEVPVSYITQVTDTKTTTDAVEDTESADTTDKVDGAEETTTPDEVGDGADASEGDTEPEA